MRVVGVIPSRWGSTRLPGKSLIDICGKPLVQWVVEAAGKAALIDELLVATDDQRIVDAVQPLGINAVMTSPDHPSGTDRIAEAIDGIDADLVVNIQGDEPLLDAALLDQLIRVMGEDQSWDMATAATPILDEADINESSVVKVVTAENGRALYFSRSVIPFIREADNGLGKELYMRHLGVYVYRREFLRKLVNTPPCVLENAEKLEQLRALYIGAKMIVVGTDDAGIGVDTPEDVVKVEKIIRADAGHFSFAQ
jgi:3-deoxy-manno-octulosonate cytidylyltransferase (CMP-KDO synthetase)